VHTQFAKDNLFVTRDILAGGQPFRRVGISMGVTKKMAHQIDLSWSGIVNSSGSLFRLCLEGSNIYWFVY